MAISGAISLDPTDGSTVYRTELRKITATLQTSGGDIPAGTMLAFARRGLLIPLNQPGQDRRDSSRFTVTINPQDPTKGTVVFYVDVLEDAATPQLTASGTDSRGVVLTWIPNKVANYVGHKLTALVTGPDKIAVPVAPDDLQTPANPEYTVAFSVTVTDDDLNDAPVAGGLANWYYTMGNDIFDNMNGFAHQNDTLLQALKPVPAMGARSTGKMFTTTTDVNGKATLFLVSKSKNTFATNVEVGSGIGLIGGGSFMVVDFEGTAVDTAPIPQGLNGNSVHFPDIDGPDVLVTVPPYAGAVSTDNIYLFINRIYSYQFNWGEAGGIADNASFKKANAYTDTASGGTGEQNTLRFVVATSDGVASTSAPSWFYGAGSQGLNEPDQGLPRVLDQLSINGVDNVINANVVTVPTVDLNVPLLQSNWTPALNDKVVVTIYLNGWDRDGDMRQPVAIPSSQTASQADVTAGFKLISFDSSVFDGWGRENYSPFRDGTFFAEYTLTTVDGLTTKRSQIYSVPLNTIGPGGGASKTQKAKP
jgi:hypothetical protein